MTGVEDAAPPNKARLVGTYAFVRTGVPNAKDAGGVTADPEGYGASSPGVRDSALALCCCSLAVHIGGIGGGIPGGGGGIVPGGHTGVPGGSGRLGGNNGFLGGVMNPGGGRGMPGGGSMPGGGGINPGGGGGRSPVGFGCPGIGPNKFGACAIQWLYWLASLRLQ